MNQDDGRKDAFTGGRRFAQRREELLRELRPVVVRRGRRRTFLVAAKGVVAGALIIAGLVGGVHALGGGPRATPEAVTPEVVHARVETQIGPLVKAADTPATHTKSPPLKIEMVQTRVGIAKAVEVVGHGSVRKASDDDLITAFYATGQEPELVRVGGRVVIAGNLGRS